MLFTVNTNQVLNRYEDFKQEARAKREKLEVSRRFQYFKRDADELESWIQEKLQAASDESYKDPTNLQVRFLNFNVLMLKEQRWSSRLFT